MPSIATSSALSSHFPAIRLLIPLTVNIYVTKYAGHSTTFCCIISL